MFSEIGRTHRVVMRYAWLCLFALGCSKPTPPAPAHVQQAVVKKEEGLHSIQEKAFCATSGKVEHHDGHFFVDQGGMRGAVTGEHNDEASISFTYRGPSHRTTPLDNGEVRRQLGLRLRAANTCNAIYVMWRIAPTSGIFVSTKKNAGEATHEQCEARGYHGYKGTPGYVAPEVKEGETHTLRAKITGDELEVWADDKTAWKGTLQHEEVPPDGPIGIRSDNGIFDFDLRLPGKHEPSSCTGVSLAKD